MSYSLILASQSPYRKTLLKRLNIPFTCVNPHLEESSFKKKHTSPLEIAESLALAKAKKIFHLHPNSCVIGGDQLAHIDNEILDKPMSPETALKQLLLLSGQTHKLITSIAVLSPQNQQVFSDITSLKMRPLDEASLKRYLDLDQPFNCAGSYKLEKSGITLFENIDSQDQSAIMGIPLIQLTQVLINLGYQIP